MGAVYKSLRILAAAVIALIVGLLTLILFGMMLPVWTMMLVFGGQEVQDAPGHGGVILFLTIPFVGLLVLIGMIPFGQLVYRKISN